MQPARSALPSNRARSFLLALAVALVGLGGLQLWHPTGAEAAPPGPPTPDPVGAFARAAVAGPTAVDDLYTVQVGGYYPYYAIPYSTNDRPGAAPLRLGATTFADGQPSGTTVSTDHRSAGFADVDANLSMQSDGRMFVYVYGPKTGTGTVRYRVVDTNGATAEALATLVVGPGGNPAVLSLRQSFPGTADVLEGDIPGRNADGTPGTIDRTSVHFTSASGPAGATISADGRTLTYAPWGVFTADPVTGVVTFDPKNTYRGPDDHISYVARDTTRAADGTVEHHAYRLDILLQVTPIDPQPVDDQGTAAHHTSVTLPGATDDRPGDPSAPLRLEQTVFLTGDDLPEGSTLYDHGRGLKVPYEGWWTLNADWTVTFTPMTTFAGLTTTVEYQLTDANGSTARAHESVFVAVGPAAKPDTGTTPQNVDVVVDVVKNDTAGRSADNRPGSMDRTTVHFPTTGQPAGATTSVFDRVLTVPGEGVYTADRLAGTITLDPEPAFVGKTSPVTYSVRDTVHRADGRVVHNLTTAKVSVTVTAITPVATKDTATTTFGRAVDVRVLGNDRAGAASAPLVPSSVRLRLVAGLPAGSQLSTDGRTLTVAGRGVFVARADGVVVFTPDRGFTGNVPAVGYQVGDANGTRAASTVTVEVTGAAVLRPTTATTRAGQTVVVDVLSNDDPPSGAGWDRSSVCLVVGSTCLEQHTRTGVGTWEVDDEGTVAFTSVTGFTGDATISYAVHDTVVGTSTSTLTVTVTPARRSHGE